MGKVSAISQRMSFDNASALLEQEGISAKRARLTQSYLRAEVQALVTRTVYQFPIIVNQPDSGNFPTQNKLNLQDAFVSNEFGIFVAAPASATDTAFKLVTYPNLTVFPTANAAAGLRTLYNGRLRVTLNNDVIVPAWDVSRHYVAPQFQQSGATNTDENDFSSDGFFPVEPNLIISGAGNYVVQLELPAALAAVEANQRIIFIARGILAQNVTSVR
jgi:hypothetical protein